MERREFGDGAPGGTASATALQCSMKGDYPMNIQELRELIAMLNDTDIAELSVESNGVKICIKKGAAFVQPPAAAAPSAPVPRAQEAGPAEAPEEPPPQPEGESENLVTVNAPMVGTFYRAPAPDAEPYVKPGDVVEVGQPLCIIEAMKLMNEIESEVRGRVVKVLVENGQPVEYGQPLFLIAKE